MRLSPQMPGPHIGRPYGYAHEPVMSQRRQGPRSWDLARTLPLLYAPCLVCGIEGPERPRAEAANHSRLAWSPRAGSAGICAYLGTGLTP